MEAFPQASVTLTPLPVGVSKHPPNIFRSVRDYYQYICSPVSRLFCDRQREVLFVYARGMIPHGAARHFLQLFYGGSTTNEGIRQQNMHGRNQGSRGAEETVD